MIAFYNLMLKKNNLWLINSIQHYSFANYFHLLQVFRKQSILLSKRALQEII